MYWFLVLRCGRFQGQTEMPKCSGFGQSSILTPNQYALIRHHLDFKYKVLFDLMYFTGARISECLSLKRIDIVGNIVVIRKCNSKGKVATRELPIPPDLVKSINKLESENEFLFSGKDGKSHLTRWAADKVLRNVCNKVGLQGYSSHSFRRTFITNLAKKNVHIKLIMNCSGHKQLSSVERYIETTEEEKLAAVSSLW